MDRFIYIYIWIYVYSNYPSPFVAIFSISENLTKRELSKFFYFFFTRKYFFFIYIDNNTFLVHVTVTSPTTCYFFGSKNIGFIEWI